MFKEDTADNSLEFVGEDKIDHVPKDENITINIGNAFDIVADMYSESRKGYDKGGYRADMNMTIVNHKDTAAEIEVVLNSYYGDNLFITWKTNGVQLEKQHSNEYKFRKVLQPDETFVAQWNEDYRP